MATDRWVVNASPLILLGKVECLHLLSALAGTVVIPRAVAGEVSAKPEGAAILTQFTSMPACCVVEDAPVPSAILGWDLGAGETQVIAHGYTQGAARVVLDDLAARRCAKTFALPIIGTLGIVGRAKAQGLIKQAAPLIERLQQSGLYLSSELVQQLLREVGES